MANSITFCPLDRILQEIDAGEAAMVEALNSDRYDDIIKAQAHKLEAARKAYEELRPLFNKLVEIGFDPELLAR